MFCIQRVNRITGEMLWLSSSHEWRAFEDINKHETERFATFTKEGCELWLTSYLKNYYGTHWRRAMLNDNYHYPIVTID